MSTLKVNTVATQELESDLSFKTNNTTHMFLTSAGALSAQSLSATQIWGDGSKLSNLPGGGKVLQVVSNTSETVNTGTTSTWASGISLSITPSSASSKILVRMSGCLTTNNNDSSPGIYIQRTAPASAAIGIPTSAGSRQPYGASVNPNTRDSGVSHCSVEHLDSPNTTSQCTYELYVAQRSGNNYTSYLNRTTDDANAQYRPRTVSTITLMEIAG